MNSEIEPICPVCKTHLSFLPWNGDSASDEICPCCFIHFGYDDFAAGDSLLRQRIYEAWQTEWIKQGAHKKWRPNKEQTTKIIASA